VDVLAMRRKVRGSPIGRGDCRLNEGSQETPAA
jgi:hypothetical protein